MGALNGARDHAAPQRAMLRDPLRRESESHPADGPFLLPGRRHLSGDPWMTAAADGDEPITRREFEARLSENGKPPVDPTANVLQLVAAANLRQDDLRLAESSHRDSMSALRDRLSREIREAERNGQRDLALAESRRIDALIEAQDQRVTLASSKAELTAVALAERVDASAKALAASVEASAKALAATVETTAKTLSERIVPLEQFRYEQAGSSSQRTEGRQSSQWAIGIIAGAPSAVLALIALVFLLANKS
jgi:hypothetical protein